MRDWRRDGYIENIGTKQANGRWLYSHGDALVVATAHALRQTGFVRSVILHIAETVQRALIRFYGFKVPSDVTGTYAVFWLPDIDEDEPSFAHLFTDNVRRIVENESTFVFMIDLELMAVHRLPPELIESLAYNVKPDHNAAFDRVVGGDHD